jgi:o-succinylbenzoate synthase
MKIEASFITFRKLKFKFSAGTSRGYLYDKDSFFIHLIDYNGVEGIGECTIIKGLSADDTPEYFSQICQVVGNPNYFIENPSLLKLYPSILFGLEMALLEIRNGGNQIYFPSEFTQGEKKLPINGLIWMGDEANMLSQIERKISENYKCIKLKVGVDIPTEIKLLQSIRERFSSDVLELRLDANGSFQYENGLRWIDEIASLNIHSIEQPISTSDDMVYRDFCRNASVDIALDEQLIGVNDIVKVKEILSNISPKYIILKPSIHGGFTFCDQVIKVAEKLNIGWWGTSALESNRGLTAIAQWIGAKDTQMYQGLGTGGLYENNFECRLHLLNGWMEMKA